MEVKVGKGHYFHHEHPTCCTDASLKACPKRTTEKAASTTLQSMWCAVVQFNKFKELIIQTPPSDEVASFEVALIAVEAEEHSAPIIFNHKPSIQEPAESPPRHRSERKAAKRAAARNMVPSIPLSRHLKGSEM